MPPTEGSLRVLVVDDNRDGADSLGLLLEALGNQVHVTYGGKKALEVAAAFRPNLMLIDLEMPDMNGCDLVTRLRRMPAFAKNKIVAVTGHADEQHKSSAMQAGFDSILYKPVALTDIKAALADVVVPEAGPAPLRAPKPTVGDSQRRLPIEEARRIRNERKTKTLTRGECEAAIFDGIIRFQDEYLGWRSTQIDAHLLKDILVVRIRGVLPPAERQLSNAASPEKGRDLVKQFRKQLLELARPMLESLIHEVAGIKVISMHHDISTVTGEEVVIFTFAEPFTIE